MNARAALAHTAWVAASAPAYLRFKYSLRDPDAAQWHVLRGNLGRNAASAYGREHHFDRISSPGEFKRRVPVVSHDELEPWIERIRHGETSVLTREPVVRFLPTSGTTRGRKLIPFTAGLQREFNAAIGPWIFDLARRQPAILSGPGYWSVTPLESPVEPVSSVVPIGFDEDSRYLGGARARLIDLLMAVPSAVRHIGDHAAFRYVVLLHLLRQRDLRLISVWHPSFLTLLLDTLAEHWDALLSDLAKGTCRHRGALSSMLGNATRVHPAPDRVRQLGSVKPAQAEAIWPALRVVSCWADGHASGAAAELQRRLPHVHIQPKGLLATEAFVTLPFADAHPLAINSHFFEFADDRGGIHAASELQVGESYDVIVTTSGGLFRYRLGDQVEVDGFVGATPSLRFLGRSGHVSDRCGEKLAEPFVSTIVRSVCPAARFAMLAPEPGGGRWHYVLYVDQGDSCDLAQHLDAGLRENPHYALCRDLGQLGPAAVYQIAGCGYKQFVAAEMKRGLRLGDIKPVALSQRPGWAEVFSAA